MTLRRSNVFVLPLAETPHNVPPQLYTEFAEIYNAFQTIRRKLDILNNSLVLLAAENLPVNGFVKVDADGKISLASNTSFANRARGIAILAVATNKFTNVVFSPLFLENFSGLSPGETYYLSDTPGQITLVPPVVSGTIVQEVGFALSETDFFVQISAPTVNP